MFAAFDLHSFKIFCYVEIVRNSFLCSFHLAFFWNQVFICETIQYFMLELHIELADGQDRSIPKPHSRHSYWQNNNQKEIENTKEPTEVWNLSFYTAAWEKERWLASGPRQNCTVSYCRLKGEVDWGSGCTSERGGGEGEMTEGGLKGESV